MSSGMQPLSDNTFNMIIRASNTNSEQSLPKLCRSKSSSRLLANGPPPPSSTLSRSVTAPQHTSSSVTERLSTEIAQPEKPSTEQKVEGKADDAEDVDGGDGEGDDGNYCAVCYGELDDCQKLCPRVACTDRFCAQCQTSYLTSVIEAARYYCPEVKCPGCRVRLPTAAWRGAVSPELWRHFQRNARHILMLRCCSCDTPRTRFVGIPEGTREGDDGGAAAAAATAPVLARSRSTAEGVGAEDARARLRALSVPGASVPTAGPSLRRRSYSFDSMISDFDDDDDEEDFLAPAELNNRREQSLQLYPSDRSMELAASDEDEEGLGPVRGHLSNRNIVLVAVHDGGKEAEIQEAAPARVKPSIRTIPCSQTIDRDEVEQQPKPRRRFRTGARRASRAIRRLPRRLFHWARSAREAPAGPVVRRAPSPPPSPPLSPAPTPLGIAEPDIWRPPSPDLLRGTPVGVSLADIGIVEPPSPRFVLDAAAPGGGGGGGGSAVSPGWDCDAMLQLLQRYNSGEVEPADMVTSLVQLVAAASGGDSGDGDGDGDGDGVALPMVVGGSADGSGGVLGHCMESLIPSLLPDPERRAALQIHWLRRFPKVHTLCCRTAMCFKCKTRGWHDGRCCAEVQRQEVAGGVQFCPGCGVPTVRSEGCSHIICVCGQSWTWSSAPTRSTPHAIRVGGSIRSSSPASSLPSSGSRRSLSPPPALPTLGDSDRTLIFSLGPSPPSSPRLSPAPLVHLESSSSDLLAITTTAGPTTRGGGGGGGGGATGGGVSSGEEQAATRHALAQLQERVQGLEAQLAQQRRASQEQVAAVLASANQQLASLVQQLSCVQNLEQLQQLQFSPIELPATPPQ